MYCTCNRAAKNWAIKKHHDNVIFYHRGLNKRPSPVSVAAALTAGVFSLAAELGYTTRKHTYFLRLANYTLEFIDFAFLWRICLQIVIAVVHQGDEAARSPLAPGEIVQIWNSFKGQYWFLPLFFNVKGFVFCKACNRMDTQVGVQWVCGACDDGRGWGGLHWWRRVFNECLSTKIDSYTEPIKSLEGICALTHLISLLLLGLKGSSQQL